MNKSTKINEASLPARLKNILQSMDNITVDSTFSELDGISIRHFLKHQGVGTNTIKQLLNICDQLQITITP